MGRVAAGTTAPPTAVAASLAVAIVHASAAPSDSDEATAAPLAKPKTGARMKSSKGKANAAQLAAAIGHASALPPPIIIL